MIMNEGLAVARDNIHKVTINGVGLVLIKALIIESKF